MQSRLAIVYAPFGIEGGAMAYLTALTLCLAVWCVRMIARFLSRRWDQDEREQMKSYIQRNYCARPIPDELDISIARRTCVKDNNAKLLGSVRKDLLERLIARCALEQARARGFVSG